jgi:hypothetical protein
MVLLLSYFIQSHFVSSSAVLRILLCYAVSVKHEGIIRLLIHQHNRTLGGVSVNNNAGWRSIWRSWFSRALPTVPGERCQQLHRRKRASPSKLWSSSHNLISSTVLNNYSTYWSTANNTQTTANSHLFSTTYCTDQHHEASFRHFNDCHLCRRWALDECISCFDSYHSQRKLMSLCPFLCYTAAGENLRGVQKEPVST